MLYLSIYLYLNLFFFCRSVRPRVELQGAQEVSPIYLSIYLCIYVCTHLSIYLSIHLSVSISFFVRSVRPHVELQGAQEARVEHIIMTALSRQQLFWQNQPGNSIMTIGAGFFLSELGPAQWWLYPRRFMRRLADIYLSIMCVCVCKHTYCVSMYTYSLRYYSFLGPFDPTSNYKER